MVTATQLRALVVGLVVAASAQPARAAEPAPNGGLTFVAPAGWTDASLGAPGRATALPGFREQADSGTYAFVAHAPAVEGGFVPNVNAIVKPTPSPPRVTIGLLEEITKVVTADIVAQGFTYTFVKRELVKVGGVTFGRQLGELRRGDVVITSLAYTIPGQDVLAVLTFSTTPAAFARQEALFDAAARATKGALEPPDEASKRVGVIVGAICGGIGGAIAGAFAVRNRKKKQETAAKPPAP
jgi:hypothetical protein